MEFALSDILCSIIGWIYLWTRYRNKKRVKKILLEAHDNSYAHAGSLLLLKSFTTIILILILLLLGIVIFVIIG